MKSLLTIITSALLCVVAIFITRIIEADDSAGPSATETPGGSTVSVTEARGRARLLHETIHGTLQIMHRDFFDDENPSSIPSGSLEDVFYELRRSHDVHVRWLTVNTDVLNTDHQADDAFEKEAVKVLAAGKPDFERIDPNRYRYAGAIRLASQCLKCHVKNRTNTKDRTAGLVITMPISHPK